VYLRRRLGSIAASARIEVFALKRKNAFRDWEELRS